MNTVSEPVSMSQEDIAQMQKRLAEFQALWKTPKQLWKIVENDTILKEMWASVKRVKSVLENEEQEKIVDLYRNLLSMLVTVVKEQEADFRRILFFDGWDTAGKGRTIREISPKLDVSFYNVVAFTGVPSEEERFKWSWFKKYQEEFLKWNKQMTMFDRSYANRCMVEAVMNYCSKESFEWYNESVHSFEERMTSEGYTFEKILLDINGKTQDERMKKRDNPWTDWKISPTDKLAKKHRKQYEHAVYEMLEHSHRETKGNPNIPTWTVIDNNTKWKWVIETIKHIVNSDPMLSEMVLEKLKSMDIKEKRKYLMLHNDVENYKDYTDENTVDKLLWDILIPDRSIVKTPRQRNYLKENTAKKEFEAKMWRPWSEKDPLVIWKSFDWRNQTGW